MPVCTQTGHNLQKRLKTSLLGVVGSFVLFAAYLAIPPLGVFAGLIAPFPVANARLLHGRITAVIILLGTATAITSAFGLFAGVLYLGMCGMTGIMMPELLIKNCGASRSLFWTTAANLAVFSVGIFIYTMTSSINIQELISVEMSNSLKQAVTLYENAGTKGEELEIIRRSMQTVATVMKCIYPALITVMFIILGVCNLLMLKKTVVKMTPSVKFDEFSEFRTPDLMVWLFIAAGFAMMLPIPYQENPALNVLLILALLYFIQGMAVVSALFKRTSISAVVRVVLYAMLIIQPYFAALIAGVGLFDLWVDFRTPKTQENL